jgi:hypothetical protein
MPTKAQIDAVKRLTKEAYGYLRHRTLDNGKTTLVFPTRKSPQWLTNLCRQAHGDMMPDNWRYKFIRDSLRVLEKQPEDGYPDINTIYPYAPDRLNWLASRVDRCGYCDEAAVDYGHPPQDTVTLIGWGMQRELDEVFHLVREFLFSKAAHDTSGPEDG